MSDSYSQERFTCEYNKVCGSIFREERKSRGMSLEKIAAGLLSKTALGNMESGKTGWRKVTGDTLFQRLGILPDYFEMVASSDELERWRMREDISLLISDQVRKAQDRIREYRERYSDREPIEEQFLQKAELLLLLKEQVEKAGSEACLQRERIETMAEAAIARTVPDRRGGKWIELPLAPSELEAFLLLGAVRMVCGRREEAWQIQQAVWDYPRRHGWRERIIVQIMPQAALLGMELALQEKDSSKAFRMGREAVEMLRRNSCHCYLLPLLERMSGISEVELWERDRAYRNEIIVFRDGFKHIYAQEGYPGYRIWQGVYVENTREAGIVLKMLRKFAGKSCAKAVYDGEEMVITERQLEKIERGEHMPSHENYQRLIRQYGKSGGWMMPMLETDSVEVLELRQKIASLIGFCMWDSAEEEIEQLKQKVDMSCSRVMQELLFFEALYMQQYKGDIEKSLDVLQKALYITMPDIEGDKKWWVFQREEIIIASNIASTYRILGKMEEAGKWCEIIRFSIQQQMNRTGIGPTGYAILMESYDSYLGEQGMYKESLEVNREAVLNYLKQPQIDTLDRAYYRIAWTTYEIASKQETQCEMIRKQWINAFQASEVVAAFLQDKYMIDSLQKKRNKYLL